MSMWVSATPCAGLESTRSLNRWLPLFIIGAPCLRPSAPPHSIIIHTASFQHHSCRYYLCVPVWLPVYLSACLPVTVCLSACLHACLSAWLLAFLPACRPARLLACLPACRIRLLAGFGCMTACMPACQTKPHQATACLQDFGWFFQDFGKHLLDFDWFLLDSNTILLDFDWFFKILVDFNGFFMMLVDVCWISVDVLGFWTCSEASPKIDFKRRHECFAWAPRMFPSGFVLAVSRPPVHTTSVYNDANAAMVRAGGA